MRCTPYGYDIVDGKAVINEETAAQVRALFRHYLDGKALTKAAELAGMKLYHGSAGRMLRNKHYLGDDYYPQIIDKETFDKAEKLRQEKAIGLGRTKELKTSEEKIMFKFTIPTVANHYLDLYDYECVVRIVALSGGYDTEKAVELLAKNNRMIASFSRALLQDLNANQSQEEFDTKLNDVIVKIYNASIS